jgi:hypothetical protein
MRITKRNKVKWHNLMAMPPQYATDSIDSGGGGTVASVINSVVDFISPVTSQNAPTNLSVINSILPGNNTGSGNISQDKTLIYMAIGVAGIGILALIFKK